MLEQEVHYCKEERDYSVPADWSQSHRHMIHGALGNHRHGTHGTCSSLPVLFAAVARRLEYPVNIVSSPGHLFCRWVGEDEHRNIEFNGDIDFFDDDHYYHSPVQWTAHTIAAERSRKIPLFLRSLEAVELFANFLAQRAHCFEAHERFNEARFLYVAASRLVHYDPHYVIFLHECEPPQDGAMQNAFDAILRPYGITSAAFCEVIQERLSGVPANIHPFPWERHETWGNPNFQPPVFLPGHDDPRQFDPFNSPVVAPILQQLIAVVTQKMSQLKIPMFLGEVPDVRTHYRPV